MKLKKRILLAVVTIIMLFSSVSIAGYMPPEPIREVAPITISGYMPPEPIRE